MAEALKRSLASWREAHGFAILCIVSPEGERFLVPPAPRGAVGEPDGDPATWTGLSEPQLRQYLAQRGFASGDTDDAIALSREWATTITGSSVFPKPLNSD